MYAADIFQKRIYYLTMELLFTEHFEGHTSPSKYTWGNTTLKHNYLLNFLRRQLQEAVTDTENCFFFFLSAF